jgi:hypothetical protein
MVYSNFMIQVRPYRPFIAAIVTGLLYFFLSVQFIHADDCEIVSMDKYDKELRSIVIDWYADIPYRQYLTEKYSCASVTVRNNLWRSIFTEDIEITATFTDKSTARERFGCEEKRLHSGEEYSCDICFKSEYPIAALECTFKF